MIFFAAENTFTELSLSAKNTKRSKTLKKTDKKKPSSKKIKCNIDIQTKIPYTIDELRKFFPDTVLKVLASPPSWGRRESKLNQITTCAVEYPLNRRTFFTITLTDYGAYDNIPTDELRDYLVLPKAFDKSTVAYNIANSEGGYFMWHEKSNSGEISFLYCYRFIIKFEIINWDNSLPELKEFVKFFNLNKLLEESKRRLNR